MKLFDAHEEDREELLDHLQYSIGLYCLDYADTFRATPEGDGIEEHVAKQSCCGAWEDIHTCKSGRTYYIGCNYGH